MSNKVYVGNLTYSLLDESLFNLFQEFGNIKSCTLVKDRDTGKNKGYAFVEMEDSMQAENAIAKLDGSLLDGRCLKVNRC